MHYRAVLFLLFAAGMTINSLNFTSANTTTVDSLALSSRTQHFAVYCPQLATNRAGYDTTPQFSTITYPLASVSCDPSSRRTFAILSAQSGANAYNLPTKMANFRTVMGNHWWEWLLPLKYSPCCAHGRYGDPEGRTTVQGSMYALGPEFDRMVREAGLPNASDLLSSREHKGQHRSQRRHKRRRRASGHVTQNSSESAQKSTQKSTQTSSTNTNDVHNV